MMNFFESNVLKKFCVQNDEIVLNPKWWNMFVISSAFRCLQMTMDEYGWLWLWMTSDDTGWLWLWIRLDDTAWHCMTSNDIGWHQMSSDDIGWHQMTWDNTGWHQITSDDIRWHLMTLGWLVLTKGCQLKNIPMDWQQQPIFLKGAGIQKSWRSMTPQKMGHTSSFWIPARQVGTFLSWHPLIPWGYTLRIATFCM